MTRKVLVSFDERLLRRVDEAAKARGVSRSRFLSELAAREVRVGRRSREEQKDMDRSLRRLRKIAAKYGTGDVSAETLIRQERDARTEKLGRLAGQ